MRKLIISLSYFLLLATRIILFRCNDKSLEPSDTTLYVSFDGGWGPSLFEIDPVTKELGSALCCAHPGGLGVTEEELWCIRTNREDGCGNRIIKLSFPGDFVEENWDSEIPLDFFASDFSRRNNQLILTDRDSKTIRSIFLE